jgi:hypothetical protein
MPHKTILAKRSRNASSMIAASLLVAGSAWAGRPLTIDDAVPVSQGAYELEAGLTWSKSPSARHLDVPLDVAYGPD